MYFIKQLIIYLAVQSMGAPEVTFDGAAQDAHSNLYRDAEQGAFEVVLNGTLEVSLELYLCLHLILQSLMYKCIQNGSSDGGLFAALEGELDGGLNVGLEWVPQSLKSN